MKELICKTETNSRDFKTKLMVTIVETLGGREELGEWEQHIYDCIKQMTNRNVLYSTGKPTKQFVINYVGKNNRYIYMCD